MLNELKKIESEGLTKIAVYAVLLIGVYYSTYTWLITMDWVREDYSASMLIPLVVLYLIWNKREALSRLPASPSWAGIGLVLVGVAFFWLGELASEFFLLYFSSWLLFVGLCWLHLGWKKLKAIAFPVALLLFMFPLPHFIHGKLSFQLKLLSSLIGVKIMQWAGMSAYREGNVIDLGFTQLQVVDACNGLRYLIPLIILGLLFAYTFKAHWWNRLFLVLSTIPIAVLVNSLRIATVGILYPIFGSQVAEGFFHDFSGWFIFMLTVVFLLGMMNILKRLPPRKKLEPLPAKAGSAIDTQSPHRPDTTSSVLPPHAGNGFSQASKTPHRKSWASPHFLTAVLLLAVTLIASRGVDFNENVPTGKPLTDFPLTIAGWHGSQRSMEQKFIDELDLSDYLITDFSDAGGKQVNFYVAYYQSQRKGEAIHSPGTCLPGSGWTFSQSGRIDVPLRQGRAGTLPVRRALMQNGNVRQLAYFWFPMRGRTLTSAWEMKLYNFWDALTRQRTDGALVRLITPIYGGEPVETAETRLQAFMKDIVPVLDGFLPK